MNKNQISKLHYKKSRILLSFLSGSSGTLAFSPYDFWPASVLSLIGLSVVILNCNCFQSCCFSFVWGLGLFGNGINWIYISINQYSNVAKPINIIITIFFIIYLTLYPVLFSTLLTKVWPSTTFARLVFASPMLWSLTEFLRSYLFGGFPWLEFGYSQVTAPFKVLAPILGVEGITFILMFISGLFIFIIINKYLKFLIFMITITCISLWALQLIHWYYLEPNKKITVTLVQGNINQKMKWNINYISETFNIYLKHSFKNINDSKIIVWPESAIPDNEITQNIFLKQLDTIFRKYNTSLITGIIDTQITSSGHEYYNSIIVIGDSIPYYYRNNNRYIKHNLVPFGETIPLKTILTPLLSCLNVSFSCFTPGKYLQPQLVVSKIKFTASICYEIIFGNRMRNNFCSDTDFLLTISNNSWFGNSTEPWQHLQMAQMRALELGRPLLHSTNNGITAFIKPNGSLQSALPQFIEGSLTSEIVPTKGLTPYAQLGSYPLRIISIIFFILSIKYKRSFIVEN